MGHSGQVASRRGSPSTSATTSGDQLVIKTAIPVFTLEGTSVDANASSRLHSFELNGRRRVGDYLTVLAGVRYLEVDEHLGFTMTNSIVPFTYDAVARNRLYGAQIGGDVTLWDRGGPLSVSGVGKAGVYGNRAGQTARIRRVWSHCRRRAERRSRRSLVKLA